MDAAEPILPELDYLATEPVQHAVTHRSYTSVKPVNENYKNGNDLCFDILKTDCATALHESYIILKCQIVKGDDSALVAADNVGPVNNLLHSMWTQVSVSLNGHEVEKLDHYPYRAYMSMLTSYSKEVLDTRGELIGWARDTAGHWNDTSLVTSGNDAGKNLGFQKRATPFKLSNVVTLVGRIDSDVMNQGRDIPPDTLIQLKLSRSSNDFVLMSSTANASYKLKLLHAELMVARDKLAPSLHKAQMDMISKYNLAINYRHSKVITHNVAIGTSSGSFTNAFNGILPDRFFAFFVNNDDFTGKLASNPFQFDRHTLTKIVAKVNETTTLPSRGEYNPSGSVEEVYYQFLREFDADEENFMLNVSKSDFVKGFAIFPFRVIPRTRGGDILAPPASGTISIDYTFETALTKTCTLVLVADFRGKFELRAQGDFSAPAAVAATA